MTCSEPRKCMWLAHIFIFEHLRLANFFLINSTVFFSTQCVSCMLFYWRESAKKKHTSHYMKRTHVRT